jgi:hypothetical protein
VRDGVMYKTDGTRVNALSTSTEATNATWDFTKVYQGTPDSVAWMVDVELDSTERPYVLFSTQRDGRGLPRGQGGMDLRYHYARLGANGWQHEEIAYAGTRLYASEDDYSGLGALDPNNPDVLYISTDADPVKGTPLVSTADGKRHYELFRGEEVERQVDVHAVHAQFELRQPAAADPELEGSPDGAGVDARRVSGESGRVVFVGRRSDCAAREVKRTEGAGGHGINTEERSHGGHGEELGSTGRPAMPADTRGRIGSRK